MTNENLYAVACENLRNVCIMHSNFSEEDGDAMYKTVTRDADQFLRSKYLPRIIPALQIYADARETVLKSKGGNVYSAVKKFIKSIPEHNSRFRGFWVDKDGRQCFCDGYRAVRLKNHIEGFDSVEGMDLDSAWPDASAAVPLELPTPGELKARIAEQKGMAHAFFDFGEDKPLVDAKFLQSMMDILPGATAKFAGVNKPIILECEDGDGILLPVHRKTA